MISKILVCVVFLGSVLAFQSLGIGADIPKDPKKALDLARQERQLGVSKLNRARSGGGDEAKLAKEAMRHLETAQEAYAYVLDEMGDDEKIEEEMSDVQSLIYWCRKMTPLREEEEESEPEPEEPPEDDGEKPAPQPLPRSPLEAPRPGDPIPKPGPPKSREELSKEYYEDAERFAKQFPDLRLQIVAQFFRVADAFRDTEWGRRALEKAMEYAKGMKKEGSEDSGTPDAGAQETSKEEPAAVFDPMLLRLRLRHKDAKVREAAINSLVETAGGDAVPDLHEMFLAETDPEVRVAIRGHLARIRDKRTFKAFRKWWACRDRQIAEDFIRLVGDMGTHKDVKYAAFTVVSNVERLNGPRNQSLLDSDGSSLDDFISTIRSAYSSGPRSVLCETCKKMGKNGSKGLTELFKTRSGAVREAIICLGAMGDVKSAKFVAFYLRAYKGGVYLAEALASLKMMGDDVIPTLITSLGQGPLKMWAAWLLRNMTGQTYSGGNPAKWWDWYRSNKRRK